MSTAPQPSSPSDSPPTTAPTERPPTGTPDTPPVVSQAAGSRDARKNTVVVCALGLIGCFFAPWIQLPFSTHLPGFQLHKTNQYALLLWLIPITGGLTLALGTNRRMCFRAATFAAVIALVGAGHQIGYLAAYGRLPTAGWGLSFTLLLGLVLLAASAPDRTTQAFDLVARKLNSRKAEVFSHWGTLTADLHFSTQDFYTKVEEAIRTKAWPGVQLLRVEYREAGILSHSREYLRIIRGRQLFDVCAASFGKDYFFSLREAELPAVVDFRAVVVLALSFFFATGTLLHLLGLLFGLLALVMLTVLLVWLLFNILKLGLTKFDSLLITLPVIGPVYEVWFRRDTYFQQDTRLFFLHCVAELVKRHVADTTSANGVKLLNGFEKKPILGGLYQPFVLPLTPAC